jgi:hypothetical protein
MPNPQNGAALFDSSQATIEVLDTLVKTSRVYAPLTKNHMESISSTGTKTEWPDQNLGNDRLTLSAGYTAGALVFTVNASSIAVPYNIKIGVHQLRTRNRSATYNVVSYNPASNTVGVTLANGTDANLASGTELWFIRNGAVGNDAPAINDVWFSTKDYNFFSNFYFNISLSNPDVNGQFKYDIKEMSFANQLENSIPEGIRTLERRAFRDSRIQGTGAATGTQGNIIQMGNGASAGGIIDLATARGMYTATGGTVAFSEDMLSTDIRQIRLNGAFSTLSSRAREFGVRKYVRAYCGDSILTYANKLTRLQRAPEAFLSAADRDGGTAGTFVRKFIVDDAIVEFEPTDGLADNEIFYCPDDSLIGIPVLRMFEEQPEIFRGDNRSIMYPVTYSTRVSSPWKLGFRDNVVSP